MNTMPNMTVWSIEPNIRPDFTDIVFASLGVLALEAKASWEIRNRIVTRSVSAFEHNIQRDLA